jgi:2-C-methyl-D-erythritol 4-phosphate cytidylyltransferase
MNVAIILSGGSGARLGVDIPKQYIEVGGKPVISYCLKTFWECEAIGAVQIVAEDGWKDFIVDTCIDSGECSVDGSKKLKGFSKPGATRQLSVWNALQDVWKYASEDDVVIIHDAARPLVSRELIVKVLEMAQVHDGAIPVLPMKDTVYYSENGERIISLLDRSRVCAGQAPEGFALGKYYEANRRLMPDEILKINGSTEPAILAGMDIAMVPGDEKNFKITTREDLKRFEQMVR